jgi:hypothetical protein
LDIAASHGPASLGKRQSTTKWKIQSSEIITLPPSPLYKFLYKKKPQENKIMLNGSQKMAYYFCK